MHTFLEIIISLIGVYITFSLINSAITEGIVQLFNYRGKYLKSQIFHFFDGAKKKKTNMFTWLFSLTDYKYGKDKNKAPSQKVNLAEDFYDHFLIESFTNRSNRSPSHIGAPLFAKVITQLLHQKLNQETNIDKNDSSPLAGIDEEKLKTLPTALQNNLAYIINKAPIRLNDKINFIEDEISKLYDMYMAQVSNWYKKVMRVFLFLMGIVLSSCFNIDSFNLFTEFKNNSELRKDQYVYTLDLHKYQDQISLDSVKVMRHLSDLGLNNELGIHFLDSIQSSIVVPSNIKSTAVSSLPIGWKNHPFNFWSIPGILLTALALSFGSTFWFSFLSKLLKFN